MAVQEQNYFHTMDYYIQKTPCFLTKILENRGNILGDALAMLSDKISEIVLMGSGSSYSVALTAKYYLQKMTKKRISLIYPNNFLRYENLYYKDCIIIGISQSGNSVAVIDALKKARSEGYKTIGMTSDLSSQTAMNSDALIDLSIGEESCGPKTLGYSATLLLLMLLGLEYAIKEEYISPELYNQELKDAISTINNMSIVHDDIVGWYETNKERLLAIQKISCVGFGANYGTAVEGSLKLIETVRCPAFGYEFEEYLHGPNDGIDKNSTIFLLGSQDEELDRMKRLHKFAKGITSECFLFTNDFLDQQNENIVPIHFGDFGNFAPLEYVIILQYLAFKISADKGINLNTIKYPEYYSIMNCKTKI